MLRDFPTFSRICIFFLLTFFSSTFLSSNLFLLSASSLLCFSSVHMVGNLTSKFPSIIYNQRFQNTYNYVYTNISKVAWNRHYNAAKKKQTDRNRTRRAYEVPFIAGRSHFTWKNKHTLSAATLYGKTARFHFVLRFPPQYKFHIIFRYNY